MDTSFITHSCEQVLRFTKAKQWDDLSEARKVQLGFNMGVTSLGLGLSKSEGYDTLTNAREGRITVAELHAHLRALITAHKISVDEALVAKPF